MREENCIHGNRPCDGERCHECDLDKMAEEYEKEIEELKAKLVFARLEGARMMQEKAAKIAQDEPELPDEMPDSMWKKIKDDKDASQKSHQIAVKLTKEGIIKSILSLNPSEVVK